MAEQIKSLNGIYKAIVADNKDPKNQNRIKVTLQFFNTPKSTQKQSSTDWIEPIIQPGLVLSAPAIGQGVWVSFKSGDPAYPVWMGEFGAHKGKNKKILIKPLPDTTSLTGITDQIILATNPDKSVSVDLMATLLAMANKIKDHETRIASLETQITTKASTSHTHPGL